MGTHTRRRARNLVAAGIVALDSAPADPGTGELERVRVRLVVPAPTRRAGRGPMTLEVEVAGIADGEATLAWLVTTNTGWTHIRGLVAVHPFRADLFAALAVGARGGDRLALRVYAAGADPGIDRPIHKLAGRLPAGSIRLEG